MPITTTREEYLFSELAPVIQARVLETWDTNVDYDWWESVYEDAAMQAETLGIDLKQKRVPLHGGGVRYDPMIYFSGFYSQGSGSSFSGTYAYKAGALKTIKANCPQDEELHRIAQELQDAQKKVFYRATATIEGVNDNWIRVFVEFPKADEPRDAKLRDEYGAIVEDAITDALRGFNHWMFKQLEAEYEYRTAEEQIREDIEANQYRFTEGGTQV